MQASMLPYLRAITIGMTMNGVLKGIRVLDLSRVFSGPFATQMLADLGADVIKVERPGTGDESRQQGFLMPKEGETPGPGFSSSYLAMNRGKRSMTVDIAKPEGQAIVRDLAAQSDVLVENYKVGDLARYGLDYQSLKSVNARLIYCSITGFGQTGPRKHLPGYDLVFQALSGVMSITGIPDGQPGAGPQRVGYAVADITASHNAVIAIMAALFARERGVSEGQHIDISLLDAQFSAASHMVMNYLVSGHVPRPVGGGSQALVPYQSFECRDQPIIVLCGNDGQFRRFVQAIGLPELAHDPRYLSNVDRLQNRGGLEISIAEVLGSKPRDEWLEVLSNANVPCAPILDVRQALEDPQLVHRGMLMKLRHEPSGIDLPQIANPLRLSETPVCYASAPPLLGQHTEEVLGELLGFARARIDELRQAGVID